MKAIITEKLSSIATEQNIRILYACESGSRGWGFPSPDSDFDVRFIYLRKYDSYLSVTEQEDSLNFAIDGALDINGWDLRKTLQLIRKSNTTPFEWLQSPIIYKEAINFRETLWTLCKQYYSPRSNSYHYLGIAKGALETLTAEGSIKIKKLFYVLRPMLSSLWSLEHSTIAPMNMIPLMVLLPAALYRRVAALIEEKATAAEDQLIHPDPALYNWIKTTYQQCLDRTALLAKDHFETEPLDQFFRETLNSYDDTGNKR